MGVGRIKSPPGIVAFEVDLEGRMTFELVKMTKGKSISNMNKAMAIGMLRVSVSTV